MSPTLSRRLVLGLAATALASAPAFALVAGFQQYEKSAFEAALKGDKPVLVHVHADWCPVCKRQETVFNDLAKTPAFAKLRAFSVEFDMDHDFKKTYRVDKQSVILVFKGGKEVARSGGVTDPKKIAEIVETAAK